MSIDTAVVDHDLRADIEDELEWDPAVPFTNIGVSVTDHAVTLSGTVHTLPERLAAVKAARRVNGVRAIVDEIVVQLEGGAGESDAAISARIEQALEHSASVPAGVRATVRSKVVTLTGEVEWRFQKQAAQRVVQDVKGVVWVQNDIVVKSLATAGAVRSKIVAAFHRNANLDAQDVHVAVDHGTIWLSGHVRSWAARQQAEAAAWSSPGVTAVHNDIVLR